jgi:NitT/TauT family transport system substrate-binding protein
VTTHSESGSVFKSRKFTDFATVKEALIAKEIGASFILAPLAMQLAADGVPIRIVYLGHRDGTALMVGKNSDIFEAGDLAGKTIAIPSRFANQNILMHKLMRDHGMPFDSIRLVELPPPEHPAALSTGSIDGYIVGEPFAAKGELDGIARVLYQAKDIWPDFISCVLAVRTDLIADERELIQELVDGIAKSGKWLDQGHQHRLDAAQVSARNYYFQPPELLEFVLGKDPDRVRYTQLEPLRGDFEEIMELGFEVGVLSRRIAFEEYADPTFVRPLDDLDWDLERLPAMDTLNDPIVGKAPPPPGASR